MDRRRRTLKQDSFTAEDAERRTDTLPTKSADCGECAEAPPPAPDGYANAVSAAPEEKRKRKKVNRE